jgi:hypothetical protein
MTSQRRPLALVVAKASTSRTSSAFSRSRLRCSSRLNSTVVVSHSGTSPATS